MVNYANARKSTKSLQIGGDNNKPVCTQVDTKTSIHQQKQKLELNTDYHVLTHPSSLYNF